MRRLNRTLILLAAASMIAVASPALAEHADPIPEKIPAAMPSSSWNWWLTASLRRCWVSTPRATTSSSSSWTRSVRSLPSSSNRTGTAACPTRSPSSTWGQPASTCWYPSEPSDRAASTNGASSAWPSTRLPQERPRLHVHLGAARLRDTRLPDPRHGRASGRQRQPDRHSGVAGRRPQAARLGGRRHKLEGSGAGRATAVQPQRRRHRLRPRRHAVHRPGRRRLGRRPRAGSRAWRQRPGPLRGQRAGQDPAHRPPGLEQRQRPDTGSRPTIPSSARKEPTRSSPTASATRSACRSTRGPASSTRPTSVRTTSKRSMWWSAAATTAGRSRRAPSCST